MLPGKGMLRDKAAHDRLQAAIVALEEKTDAEVMLAITRSSGSYRDIDHLAGTLAALLVLVVMLFVHFHGEEIDDHWVVSPVVAAYAVVAVISSRTFALRRLLTSARRRGTQVANAARSAFVEEHVHATKRRDGLLIYFSALEREVEIIPDLGIEGRLESGAWSAIQRDLEAAAHGQVLESAVTDALGAVGKLLAEKVPKTPHDPDEIPHRLRVRS